MKRTLLSCIAIIACTSAQAQDVHFSQYYENSVLRNPALTGVFSEDYKAGIAYRSQWNALGNPYKTMMATAESRFSIKQDPPDYLTVSALFYSDKAGRAALQSNAIYACVNYNKSMSDPHNSYLSVGFTGGYVQRSFDPSKLTFDNMYQMGVYEPNAGAGEELPMNKTSYWDLGAGVSFNSGVGEDNRILYYLGLSGYHFTSPRATFSPAASPSNLAMRFTGSMGLSAAVGENFNVQLHTNLSFQGAYREYMIGGLVRYARLGDADRREFGISAGAQLRLKDAIIPTVKLEYKGQSLAISYDINNSPLRSVTHMRGGLEFTAFFTGYFRGGYEGSRPSPRF